MYLGGVGEREMLTRKGMDNLKILGGF